MVINLPTEIKFEGTNNKITYLYNAAGQKLNKTVFYSDSIKIVDYLDGFQTEARGSRTPKKRRSHKTRNSEQNHTATLANFDLKILNFQNLICPFGLKHAIYDTGGKKDYKFDENDPEEIARPGFVTSIPYQYKYNGQEWQDELGLNMYDMDMRQYDPAIGRWVVQDPVVHHSMSPYNSFDNNPVFWADPSGADSESVTLRDLWDRTAEGTNSYWVNQTDNSEEENECDGCVSSNTEKTTTITESFIPINFSEGVGNDKISYHTDELTRTVYLQDGIAVERSVRFVTIYEVIIDSNGSFPSIYYTQYTYLNGEHHATKSEYIDANNSSIPEILIGKMNSISQYKIKNKESPRQTEAKINQGENTNLTIIATGLGPASRYLMKSPHPLGKVGGVAGYIIMGGISIYTQFINSSDPRNIKIISTSHEKRKNTPK